MTEFRRFFQAKEVDPDFLLHYNRYFKDFLQAIHRNYESRLQELLSQANATSRRNEETNETVLHIAVRFGSIALVTHIIDLGTEINAEDYYKHSPLYRATVRSPEMVQCLLKNGANPNNLDWYNTSPIQRALLSGSTETVNVLLQKIYSIKPASNLEDAPTDFQKCREVVKIFLDRDIDPNWEKYSTLLQFVAKYGDEETFRLVLSKNKDLDINALNPDEHTLLHFLVNKGKTSLVKILLDYGADVNLIGYWKKTALHYAIMRNDATMVRLLLDHGAEVHQLDPKGNTFLLSAVRFGSKEIVEILLNAGAEINVEARLSSVLQEACGATFLPRIYEDSEFVFNYMEKFIRWRGSSLEIIKLLIERGAKVNAKNVYGETPLLVACGTGRFDLVRLLVDSRADLHVANRRGETALHYAVVGNNINLVRFLLCNQFHVNVIDKIALTPLNHIFMKNYHENYVEMMEFLVDNGANVNISTPFQVGLIIMAISWGQPEEVVCLLELQATGKVSIEDVFVVPYSFLVAKDVSDSMAFRQLTAFWATKENDISLCIKRREDNEDPVTAADEKVVSLVESFFQKCKLEAGKMKSKKICDERKVSYFDFLTKQLLDVVPFTTSRKLMNVLDSGEYKEEFPCYAFMMEKRIERVKKLRNYVDMIKDFLQKDYAKINLPIVVLGKIFSFWSVGDVRNFGRALSGK